MNNCNLAVQDGSSVLGGSGDEVVQTFMSSRRWQTKAGACMLFPATVALQRVMSTPHPSVKAAVAAWKGAGAVVWESEADSDVDAGWWWLDCARDCWLDDIPAGFMQIGWPQN